MADPSVLAASSTAVWASVTGWFTPMSLFLLLNIMIGTILISSRFHSSPSSKDPNNDHHHYPHQYGQPGSAPLARAPSLIDRVRSINFSGLYKFDHHPVHPEYHQHHFPEHTTEFAAWPDPPQAPSLLQRLKSINFTPYIFDQPMPAAASETEYAPRADPAPIARAPSLLERLKSINFSSYRYNQPDPIPESDRAQAYSEPAQARRGPIRADPPPVAPVPSFLERVKSINFSLYGQEESDSAADFLDHEDHLVKRVKSDTKPRGGEAPAKLSSKMKKSASDKSSFVHFKSNDDEEEAEEQGRKKGRDQDPAAVEEAEEIDAKADDFINRFKQQLKLQRLDSIMRYKEMLTRGAS